MIRPKKPIPETNNVMGVMREANWYPSFLITNELYLQTDIPRNKTVSVH